MLGMMARVVVRNVDNHPDKYIVARLVMGELWYWGSWNHRDAAEHVAEQFENGIVVERCDEEDGGVRGDDL